jgi:hypothetical protein
MSRVLNAARENVSACRAAVAMELLRDSILMVSLAISAAALYARAASSCLRPGFPLLIALLPVVAFLATVPLAAFKVALLAARRGPLEPDLPVLPFVFTAALPVKLARRPGPSAGETATSPKAKSRSSLVLCAVKEGHDVVVGAAPGNEADVAAVVGRVRADALRLRTVKTVMELLESTQAAELLVATADMEIGFREFYRGTLRGEETGVLENGTGNSSFDYFVCLSFIL